MMNEQSRQKAWILIIFGIGLFFGPFMLHRSLVVNVCEGIPLMFYYVFLSWLLFVALIGYVNKNL